MTGQRRPDLQVLPSTLLRVRRGEEFEVTARVKNTTGVIDAFDLSVLGLTDGCRSFEPGPIVALFPDLDDTVVIRITLPDDFPAGETKLWIKASSQAAPAIDVVAPLRLYVEQDGTAAIEMFPKTLAARRNGRFGITVSNTGNGPLNVSLDATDDQNAFTYEVVPNAAQRIASGATVSFQAILTGHRSLVGVAVPTPFTITPSSDGVALADENGQPLQVNGTFAPKPLIPMLLAVFAGVVALLALWGVVVGAAIDALVDDANDDVASSIEDGLNKVVDGLGADEDAAAAAQADVVAAAGADGESPSAEAVGGLAGEAVGVTNGAAGQADDAAPMNVEPNELAGTLTAASNGVLIPGGKVTARPLLPGGNFTQDGVAVMAPDPNRPRIEAISDEVGVFRMPDLLPGAYDVVITVPGYVEFRCDDPVVVPAPPSASCIVAGQEFTDGLSGDTASIAGIVLVDGSPLTRTTENELTVRLSRLMPVEGSPEGTPAGSPDGTPTGTNADTLSRSLALQNDPAFEPQERPDGAPVADGVEPLSDGRFSFVMNGDEKATPGTFELIVSAAGYSDNRQVFELGPGQKLIGLQVAMVPPLATATPAAERVLSGTVYDGPTVALDANGQPVLLDSGKLDGDGLVGASVTAVGPASTFTVMTDEKGEFEIVGVPAGAYSISIQKDDYLTRSVSQSVPAAEADPPTDTRNIVLTPAPGSLSGTTTDAATSVGVAGVTVTIDLPPPAVDITVTTDVDGRYEFASLAPDTYQVTYTPPAPYASAAGNVTIAANQERVADVALVPATTAPGSLTGTVTDARSGVGVAGVTVSITPGPTTGPATVTTDVDGRYEFASLGPGNFTITYDSAGRYATGAGTVRIASGEARVADVGLEPATTSGAVSGIVTDARTGLPLPGSTVTATSPTSTGTAVTDASGFFRITGLAGQSEYTVASTGSNAYTAAIAIVRLTADSREGSVTLVATPRGVVAGTVQVTLGTAGDVTVSAAGPGGTYTTATDAAGGYRIEALPPGVYSVTYSKGLTTTTRTAVVVGSDAARPLVIL